MKTKDIISLIEKKRYVDASSLACFTNKTKETRALLSEVKKVSKESLLGFESLLLFDAPNDFDCYCRYLDFRQQNVRNFYVDRRKFFKDLNDIFTDMLIHDKYDVVRVKMRTRSGKSENLNRLAFWVQGNNPSGETLHCCGGGKLRNNIYEKRLAFIDEYWDRHCDVFPLSPPILEIKSSKDLTAVWFRRSEYADISTVTVGGSIEGHVQCTNLLVMDDLVSSTEINSASRLEEIYRSDILNAIMRRYVSGKTILLGTPIPTLTNVDDPLDAFYKNRQLAGFRCTEYSLPSLDENMESNYSFRNWIDNKKSVWIFSTESLMKERNAAYNSNDKMLISMFETTYQMKPMERGERRFASIKEFDDVPDGKYDEITVLDPADTGTDAAVCWHARIYTKEPEIIYAYDVFYDKRPLDRLKNGGFLDDLVDFFIKNDIHSLLYEANMGGTLLGGTLTQICKERNWVFSFKTYKQMKNKIGRINDFASETLKKVRLRKLCPHEGYELAKAEIIGWSEKSSHDDSPDCLTKIVEETVDNKPNRIVFI